jgi:hypothetical protein
MVKRIGAGLAGLCTALVLFAAPAQAATGTQTFKIVFSGDPRSGVLGRVAAIGVINGLGTDETIAQDPHPDGSETDTDLITLPGGTITIIDTDPSEAFSFDPGACIATIGTSAGTFTVAGGTGRYAGASGGGTFTARGLVIFDRVAGGCSEEPRSFFAVVTATGTISVP